MTRMPRHDIGLKVFMKAENECWRLAQSCVRWAAETHDRSVRNAFFAMAKEWSRLGLLESADDDTGDGQRRLSDRSFLDSAIMDYRNE